jgi:ATP-dependent Clp protease protease subunit
MEVPEPPIPPDEPEQPKPPPGSPVPVLMAIAAIIGLCVVVGSIRASARRPGEVTVADRFGRRSTIRMPDNFRLPSDRPDEPPPPQPSWPGPEVMKQRIVRIEEAIDEHSARMAIAKLLILNDTDPSAPIHVRVASPRGQVAWLLTILDAMDKSAAPVHTRCEGPCEFTTAIIVANGTKGGRTAAPGTGLRLTGGNTGDVDDETTEKVLRVLAERLAVRTGQPVDTVMADMRAGRRFTARQAVEYGLIDKAE